MPHSFKINSLALFSVGLVVLISGCPTLPPPVGCSGSSCNPEPDPVDCSATNSEDCLIACEDEALWPAAWKALEAEVINRINAARQSGQQCGDQYHLPIFTMPPVAPLTPNAALSRAARCHVADMATLNYFGHDSLDGSGPKARMLDAGYRPGPYGENIGFNDFTADQIMHAWIVSGPHCENFMDKDYKDIGIGYAPQEDNYMKTLWTMDLARPK